MKYLNLGCGNVFSLSPEWTNVTFNSSHSKIISHNLLQGIPSKPDTFDAVYHSHILEHFSKKDGELFIKDCYRVLKNGGIIRIAVPDLEVLARNYMQFLEVGMKNPNDTYNEANYEWTMIELFDQMVRNVSGGNMAEDLSKEDTINRDFIISRIGIHGNYSSEALLEDDLVIPPIKKTASFINTIKHHIKMWLIKRLMDTEKSECEALGRFRLGGEIHQWMYDRYSLQLLLQRSGFTDIRVLSGFESNIPEWNKYQLDVTEGVIRKPDSLFIEARK